METFRETRVEFKPDLALLHTHTALHTQTAGIQLISAPSHDRATHSHATTPADGFEQRVDAGKRGSRQGQARDSRHFRRKTLPRARNGQPRTWLTQARARAKEALYMVHENDYVARYAPREREKAVYGCSDWRARDRVRGERRATRRSRLLSPSRCMRVNCPATRRAPSRMRFIGLLIVCALTNSTSAIPSSCLADRGRCAPALGYLRRPNRSST